jgi:hypothetical protein
MTNQDHVFNILDDALLLLSSQGLPTPEKTYKLEGGWGLALSDLRRCFDQHRARVAELEAERDEARAGESRAVEALKVAYDAAEQWHGSVEWEGREYTQAVLHACHAVLADSQPALDWLAQREREAAARELEGLMEREWIESFELKASINARIAALTTQQPAACPRSEVRGEGES